METKRNGPTVQVEPEIELVKVPLTNPEILVEKDHQRLANKLGTFQRQRITPRELEEYLLTNIIGVYPMASVVKYLDNEVKKRNSENQHYRWAWYPLRLWDVNRARYDEEDEPTSLYNKLVPVPVLMTVERIVQDLGSQVRFLVSDIREHREPVDPFLMITALRCPRYVIERWNEPGFRS